jgi:hypothetical protein
MASCFYYPVSKRQTLIPVIGILGFVMVVTFCFCITDVVTMIVESTSVFPYVDVRSRLCAFGSRALSLSHLQIFQSATGSTAGTIALVSIITALNICANLSVLAAGSRQVWSFARDEGMPFSGWLRKITVIGTPIPLNAIMISLTVTIVVSLLNIASAAAFNSIVGLLCGSGGVSYSISIGCVLWRRLAGKPLPEAPFRLGVWVS